MKKKFLFAGVLQMLIISIINVYSQSIIPINDTTFHKIISTIPKLPFFGSKDIHYTIKDTLITIDPLVNGSRIPNPCGEYHMDNFITFPSFGYQEVPSPDIILGNGGEISVAVDPNDERVIRCCYMQGIYGSSIACKYSEDLGASWQEAGPTLSYAHGDQSTIINSESEWFFSFLQDHGSTCVNTYVELEKYSGSTWTGPMEISGPQTDNYVFDKPHLAVDDCPETEIGNLYCAWTPLDCPPEPIPWDYNFGNVLISKSENNGANWYDPQPISTNKYYHPITNSYVTVNQGVNIQCGPNGEVYTVWVATDRSIGSTGPKDEMGLFFNRSIDFGETYELMNEHGPGSLIQTIHGISGFPYGIGPAKLNSFPSMCVDKSEGPKRGRIYIVWANAIHDEGRSRINVNLIYSDNLGNSWTPTPIVVNFHETYDDNIHSIFPWISCDKETGALSVIYYDDRSGYFDAYVAMSKDYGNNWEDCRVSDNAFVLSSDFFGEYIGICCKNGIQYPIFVDNFQYNTQTSSCSPRVVVSPFYTWNCASDYTNVTEDVPDDFMREWEVSNTITASNKIDDGGVAVFRAGTEIVFLPEGDLSHPLDPGFWAKNRTALNGNGRSFVHAYIEDCGFSSSDKVSQKLIGKLPISNDQNLSESNIKIFPNPSNGKFKIDLANLDAKDCRIEITNFSGTPVYSLSSSDKTTIEIDISNYPKGVYLIKLYIQDKSYVSKMVYK